MLVPSKYLPAGTTQSFCEVAPAGDVLPAGQSFSPGEAGLVMDDPPGQKLPTGHLLTVQDWLLS